MSIDKYIIILFAVWAWLHYGYNALKLVLDAYANDPIVQGIYAFPKWVQTLLFLTMCIILPAMSIGLKVSRFFNNKP